MTFRNVLITGASSGIGHALAAALAQPGATLHLGGRDSIRLATVAAACRDRGAQVHETMIDVRDQDTMAAWVQGAGSLDLVIANAGVSRGTLGNPPDATRTIFAVNLDGALNTVLPALAVMERQAPGAAGIRGHIAVIASVAAFMPLPGSSAYCASKAAIDTWTVANAPSARAAGVILTSVCPGYIRSPMTAANRFPMPGLMDADRAAAVIVRGIAAGRTRVTFPWWVGALARLGHLLPPRMVGTLFAHQAGDF
jgi:short-subunit dehydrogenase